MRADRTRWRQKRRFCLPIRCRPGWAGPACGQTEIRIRYRRLPLRTKSRKSLGNFRRSVTRSLEHLWESFDTTALKIVRPPLEEPSADEARADCRVTALTGSDREKEWRFASHRVDPRGQGATNRIVIVLCGHFVMRSRVRIRGQSPAAGGFRGAS